MKQYLLDASAFILLIKKADVQTTFKCLQESMVLDLTYYEVGNAIWKESTLKFLTAEESNALERVTHTILSRTDRITSESENFQNILKIGKNEKISFYDSSYIYFAQQKNIKLITEDKQLKAKAEKYVDVKNIASILSEINS
jgi:predicted nucleic acid-binding protein